MELKSIYGTVIFALEGAKTVLELVTAAHAAQKSLSGAVLSGAVLSGAVLRNAVLSGAVLRNAVLSGAVLSGAVLSGAVLRNAGLDGIPLISNIHQSVYEAASQPKALDMGAWHKCETTHCRAGWVIALAGPAGRALEWAMGTPAAAAVIYLRNDPKIERIPNFYADNQTALEDMRRLADAEKAATTAE
jgi:Pentapeptide repeats (8 copies)